jgi:hypothetical protein
MSKFEKIFWAVISVFMLIFIVFSIIASSNTPNLPQNVDKKPVLPIIFEYGMKDNLDKHAKKIIDDKNIQLEKINNNVNEEIDKLFISVENNVDVFLDFHYSVYGEYAELTAMVMGDIEKTIQQKLFGSDFESKAEKTSNLIHNKYKKNLKKHLDKIEKIGSDGIDTKLNAKILTTLHNDIFTNEITQKGKVGLLVASRFVPRLVQTVSTKLAGKFFVKVIAKTSAKLAAATTGAVAGTVCGPFVWVCSPIAAVGFWFGTDAAIVTTLEVLGRDDFKKEIVQSIKDTKQELKNNYTTAYSTSFNNFSEQTVIRYGGTRIKVKDRIIGK